MTSFVFYLVLVVGSSYPSQTSTPIGSEKDCVAAGEKIKSAMTHSVYFACVEGVL